MLKWYLWLKCGYNVKWCWHLVLWLGLRINIYHCNSPPKFFPYTHSSILLHPIQSATRWSYCHCFQVTVMYAMPFLDHYPNPSTTHTILGNVVVGPFAHVQIHILVENIWCPCASVTTIENQCLVYNTMCYPCVCLHLQINLLQYVKNLEEFFLIYL